MLADAIDMPAHQFRRLCRRTAAALTELFGADQRADAETDPPLARRHRFARQHRRAQRPGQHRQPVEHRRIARRNMHRQNRCLAAQRQPREAVRPAAVTHAAGAHARDLAGRKHDQRLAMLQRAIDASQARGGALAEHVHRQQQLAQWRHRGQPVVAQDAHVAAYRTDHLQQRQRILHAQRMVGHHQQRAFRRNVLEIARIDVMTGTEHIQYAIDEIETLGGTDPIQHTVEAVFIGQASEHARHRPADAWVLRQPWQSLDKGLFDTQHVCVLGFPPSWRPIMTAARSPEATLAAF